jgi:hypothetical protein
MRRLVALAPLVAGGCVLTESFGQFAGGPVDGGVPDAPAPLDAGGDAEVSVDAGTDADAAAPPIAFVQGMAANGTTPTLSVSLPSVGVHHALVVSAHWSPGSPSLVGITDSAKNAFEIVSGPVDGANGRHFLLATYDTPRGDDTVTLTVSAATTNVELYVDEYDGLALSTALDRTAAMSGTSAATDGMTSGPLTVSLANELVYAFAEATDTKAGTGFTTRSSFGKNVIEDLIVTRSGSVTATATMTTGSGWTLMAASFKGR